MRKNIAIEEVAKYINNQSPETQVYLGVDSERVMVDGTWHVDFLLCVVVHIDGCHGAKIFGWVERELDFDKNLSKPRNRLIREAYKITGVYLELQQLIAHDIHIHLDLNPNEMYGSSCVVQEAIGYVKGVCGISPEVKPHAWAASIAADRLKSLI